MENNNKKSWFIWAIIAVVVIAGIVLWTRGGSSGVNNGTNSDGTSMVQPYGKVILGLNQDGVFPGITIRPISIAEDSRCKTGVQCIWAGTVRVVVNSTSANGGSVENTIKLGQTLPISTFTVGLTAVDPYPQKDGKISDSDYRFTFEVHQSANATTSVEGLQSKG